MCLVASMLFHKGNMANIGRIFSLYSFVTLPTTHSPPPSGVRLVFYCFQYK